MTSNLDRGAAGRHERRGPTRSVRLRHLVHERGRHPGPGVPPGHRRRGRRRRSACRRHRARHAPAHGRRGDDPQREFLTREASRSQYAPGTEFQISQIDICASTGTYLDSPFHRYADGADLSALLLERLADLDAVVVDLSGSATRAVDAAQLMPYEVSGRAVLVHTGWDRHWRTEAYFGEHPFLTAAAAEHLARRGAILVGVDSVNVDDTTDPSRPAHSILLGAGIAICEHLTNLGELPAEGARFTAAPLKIFGVGSFPVRAYAAL